MKKEMTRDEAFELVAKHWEENPSPQNDYSVLIQNGPQTVDQFIAEIVLRWKTIFMETGMMDFKNVFDIVEPHSKKAYEILYQKLYPENKQTFKDYLTENKFIKMDNLAAYLVHYSFTPGKIKELFPEEVYTKVCELTNDETIAAWSKTRTNPIVNACLAVTSNCSCVKNFPQNKTSEA